MSHVRAIVRLLLFVGTSVLVRIGYVLSVMPLVRLSPRRAAAIHDVWARTWARLVCRILGMRLSWEGPLPARPFVLVSNHLGYVDIVTFMAILPADFVARADMRRWPLLGNLARTPYTIFIDRASRMDVAPVNARIRAALADGRGLVIFPEGTSSGGTSVLPFRASLLDPAARIGHPVHFASLSYRSPEGFPPASESVCWWGDMTFLRHFYGLLRLPSFEARVVFGPDALRAPDRRALADALHGAVEGQLVGTGEHARCT